VEERGTRRVEEWRMWGRTKEKKIIIDAVMGCSCVCIGIPKQIEVEKHRKR